MKVTIHSILESKPEAFNGLTQTNFTTEEAPTTSHYIFSKPGNAPQVGDTLEGEITKDKAGRNKFTKAKPEGGFTGGQSPVVKEFRADKDKMKQDFSLEVAKNQSIQRQVATKAAVELIVAGKAEYSALIDVYQDLMCLLTNPDWKNVMPVVQADEPYEDDDLMDDIDFSMVPE